MLGDKSIKDGAMERIIQYCGGREALQTTLCSLYMQGWEVRKQRAQHLNLIRLRWYFVSFSDLKTLKSQRGGGRTTVLYCFFFLLLCWTWSQIRPGASRINREHLCFKPNQVKICISSHFHSFIYLLSDLYLRMKLISVSPIWVDSFLGHAFKWFVKTHQG